MDVEAEMEVLGTTEVAEGTGEEEVEGSKDVAGSAKYVVGSGKDVAVTLKDVAATVKDGLDTKKGVVGMEVVVGADAETSDVAATIKAQV